MPEWLDFVRQLVGTLIGAGVGFWLAMSWDRYKVQKDRRQRQLDTVKSLLYELDRTEHTVDIPGVDFDAAEKGDGSVEVDMRLPFLLRSAFDGAVSSGNLALLPPKLQGDLSAFYEQLRICRLFVDNAATSHARGMEPEEEMVYLSNAYQHLCGHCSMLADELRSIRSALQKAKEEYLAT